MRPVAAGAVDDPRAGAGRDAVATAAAGPDASLEALAPNAVLRGFTVVARYRDGSGRAVGGRFVHQATGFELDTLRIDSAPQAFIWVNSLPTSDAGEPHTQEHLLLGKGTVGSRVANLEEMSLAESSAFTEQWRTCYHMHVAVAASFWAVLEADLDGLLHPDYTDEEIRREVRNFGVTSRGGKLVLEEKGTVYNEMVRSYEQPEYLLWRKFAQAVYGAAHPLALSSGGWPDAIRAMTPEDIRRFHRDHYHLANMGMVASLPPQVTLDELLRRTDEILVRLAGDAKQRGPVVAMDKLPAPQGVAPGTVDSVEYPSASAANPSPLFLVWPATRNLPLEEKVLLEPVAPRARGRLRALAGPRAAARGDREAPRRRGQPVEGAARALAARRRRADRPRGQAEPGAARATRQGARRARRRRDRAARQGTEGRRRGAARLPAGVRPRQCRARGARQEHLAAAVHRHAADDARRHAARRRRREARRAARHRQYVALLPQLLDEVGIAGEGETIPYDEVNERLRKEILGLAVRFESNARTGRVELVVAGAGNDVDEARRALAWMGRVLLARPRISARSSTISPTPRWPRTGDTWCGRSPPISPCRPPTRWRR